MDRQALKDLMYGGLEEIINNGRYYYNSSIGSNYNHFTDAGKENVTKFMEMMAGEMFKCRQEEDAKRSKDMVMKELTAK